MNNSSAGAGSSSKSKAAPSQTAETSYKRKRGVLQKDLKHMMYGFGDNPKAAPSQPAETSHKRKHGVFQKDLQHMMYGFGDDPNPLPESLALMEDIVVEYITDLVHKAQGTGSKRGNLAMGDVLYLIRKDLPKLNRCRELLSMNEDLKEARNVFETDEDNLGF